jgi:hypothetical protein
LVGALGGYLVGGGSANRNAILAGAWDRPPLTPVGFGGHRGGGVSHYELNQSEKIARLEAELYSQNALKEANAKTDGVLALYNDMRVNQAILAEKVACYHKDQEHGFSSMRKWVNSEFIHQPKVDVSVTGAALVPEVPIQSQ